MTLAEIVECVTSSTEDKDIQAIMIERDIVGAPKVSIRLWAQSEEVVVTLHKAIVA